MRRIVPVELSPEKPPSIELPPSKSIYNRHRILYHLAKKPMPVQSSGLPADCRNLDLALSSLDEHVYLGQGGTSLRFYLASRLLEQKPVCVHIDEQLKSRPIEPLLDALEHLGLKMERGWPLKIEAAQKIGSDVSVNASASSQFVSALALVGAFMENSLVIKWTGHLPSRSFLHLTLDILEEWDISYTYYKDGLHIGTGYKVPKHIFIPGDWASASYAIMGAALRKQPVFIENLIENTGQPDERIKNFIAPLGVVLKAGERGMWVECSELPMDLTQMDFSNCPDLAPTFCIWHLIKGIPIWFTGLKTLNSKESQRLNKMAELLKDMQLEVRQSSDSLICEAMNPCFPERYVADTSGDHRLAMAFSELCLCIPHFSLSEVESVEKSFPNFWEQMSCWKIALK